MSNQADELTKQVLEEITPIVMDRLAQLAHIKPSSYPLHTIHIEAIFHNYTMNMHWWPLLGWALICHPKGPKRLVQASTPDEAVNKWLRGEGVEVDETPKA